MYVKVFQGYRVSHTVYRMCHVGRKYDTSYFTKGHKFYEINLKTRTDLVAICELEWGTYMYG